MLVLLDSMNFKCKYCNYIPRANEIPSTGVWYCPKCGKRTKLEQKQKKPHKYIQSKKPTRRITRDQASSQTYSQYTREKKNDYGLKTPYLTPPIEELRPKRRTQIPVFYKSKSKRK